MKFAIIETGGKQYFVKPEDTLKIEKLKIPKEGGVFAFDKVLLLSDGEDLKIGKPYLPNVKIEAEWQKDGRGKKIRILRYHSKTRLRRRKGHRQEYTQIKIK